MPTINNQKKKNFCAKNRLYVNKQNVKKAKIPKRRYLMGAPNSIPFFF